jgi:hypothetical protein
MRVVSRLLKHPTSALLLLLLLVAAQPVLLRRRVLGARQAQQQASLAGHGSLMQTRQVVEQLEALPGTGRLGEVHQALRRVLLCRV